MSSELILGKLPTDQEIIQLVMHWQKRAYAPISHIQVGAVVLATNVYGELGVFQTCNFEISNTVREHAEKMAVRQAFMNGFRFVHYIYVSSQSNEEQNYLCPECRAYISKLKNPNITIIVINPDGTIKGKKLFSELLPSWQEE